MVALLPARVHNQHMEIQDEMYMRLALEQALASKTHDDVPFGAIIVLNGQVIAAAENSEMRAHDVTKHAEVMAIAAASEKLGRDLSGCTIYSTVEPCTMCSGAILYACLSRVVIGAMREDLPHLFRVRNIRFQHLADDYGHAPEVISGVLRDEAVAAFDGYKLAFRVPTALIQAAKKDEGPVASLVAADFA